MSDEAREAALKEAQAALEHDRTRVIDAVNAITDEIARSSWLMGPGRGSYEWDDDRYRQEFGAAMARIDVAADKLRKIGADWSNCPTTDAEIQAARIDWKARAEKAEAALAAYEAAKPAGEVVAGAGLEGVTKSAFPELFRLLEFLKQRARGGGHLTKHEADTSIEPLLDAIIAVSGTSSASAALAASPVPSEPVFEPGTIRVCPERDGRCPHGLNCPYTLDRGHCDIDASRAALTRPEPAQDAGVKL